MFNKFKSLKYLPFLYIFLIWSIFAVPYFLKEKVPYPSDYQVNFFAPWSAYEQFWGPVKNNAMPDIITQVYPWKHFTIEQWKKGQIPLWNPYSFSGTPHLANYQSAVLSPFNLLFFIFSFVDAWSFLVFLQPLLASVFMYLFLRSIERSVFAALIGSLSFMFCGFIVSWMGYATLGYAILFLPLALFSIEKYYSCKKNRYLILLSLSISLSFFSGHFQISLYFLIFIIAYIIYKLLVTKSIPDATYLMLHAVFGLLISLPQILPSIEFYGLSVRSNIFQKMEVIPWNYLPTLLAPDFYGNPVTRNDWFGHYAEWNGYMGVLPILFGVYTLRKIRVSSRIIFFVFMSVFSVLLAYNSPLVDLLVYYHVPVLSTSAASRIIVLFSFSMAVLSAFGFDSLLIDIKNKKLREIFTWLFFFCTIFAILWVIVFLKLIPDPSKISISKSNLILSSAFFVSFLFLLIPSLFIKKTISNFKKLKIIENNIVMIFSLAIVFIVSFDMLRFVTKWMPFAPKKLVFAETSVSKFFPDIFPYERVVGNYEAGEGVYYELPSIEGYDPLYIERYGQFVRAVEGGGLKDAYRSVVTFPRQSENSFKILNLLGTKYIIHKKSDEGVGWAFPVWNYTDDLFLVFEDDKFKIYENKKLVARPALISRYKVIKSSEKIIDEIFDKNINLENQIILEEDPLIPQIELTKREIEVVDYSPNNINIKTESDQDSVLLLTDNYYPGWKSYIDGKETKIYRANYTFRSIVVPKGTHDVKFEYHPDSFRLGIYFAIFGSLGILIVGVYINKNSKVKNQNLNLKLKTKRFKI